MRKPRILWVSEASFLHTGYAVYGREILSRLYKTGKYEIAELGCYGHVPPTVEELGEYTRKFGMPQMYDVPWRYYGNMYKHDDDNQKREYDSVPTNQFGEWRFERVCLDFKPDIVVDIRDWWMCLTGDNFIVTDKGITNIKNIKKNDLVLTHTGKLRKVLETKNRNYFGKFYTIKSSHCPFPVKVTADHPILAVKRIKPTLHLDKPQWINSQDIKKNDLVVVPVEKEGFNTITPTLGRLVGYYAAEGCILYNGRKEQNKPKGIQLTLNSNETVFIEDIKECIAKEFNSNTIVKIVGNTAILRSYNVPLAKFMMDAVPGTAKIKYFRESILSLNNDGIKHVLCGLFRGDGGYYENRASYTTSSEQLAHQVFRLSIRLGLLPSFNENKNSIKEKTYDRYIFSYRDNSFYSFKQIYENKKGLICAKRIKNGYAYLTVDEVIEEEYGDIIYNFEVEEDNSYVSSFTLHNCEFIERSPYRPYFKWAIMPTVDSEPQQEQYLSTFLGADAVFAYSEYGRDVLARETNGKVNFIDVASPGANLEVMKPHPDKVAHRSQFGIVENANIVGTVMRNQARKLYPDLFEAFKLFIETADKKTANDTYLYVHTSFPDSGWDIPYWLRQFDLGNKVLFTYKCMNCQHVFPAFFRDARTVCRRCSAPAAKLPNTVKGLTDEELAGVYNLFDVYVQYSVCEGFGMPQVEAAACGVTVMAVNYSAMASVVENLGGFPIHVERYFYDSGTGSKRALPDNKHLVEELKEFFRWPKQVRQKLGRDHYNKARKIYSYDRIAGIWEKYFDSVELKDAWSSPPRIHEPRFDIPPNLNNEEFVRWCIKNVWGEPSHLNSFLAMKFLRDLNYGEAIKGTGDIMYNEASYLNHNHKYQTFSHQDAANNFARLADRRNFFEKLRVGMITEPKPDYIRMVKKEE